MVAGHVAQFHGPVSAKALRGIKRYRAFAELEYGERVGAGLDKVVIEAVMDQCSRRGFGLSPSACGEKDEDRG